MNAHECHRCARCQSSDACLEINGRLCLCGLALCLYCECPEGCEWVAA